MAVANEAEEGGDGDDEEPSTGNPTVDVGTKSLKGLLTFYGGSCAQWKAKFGRRPDGRKLQEDVDVQLAGIQGDVVSAGPGQNNLPMMTINRRILQ